MERSTKLSTLEPEMSSWLDPRAPIELNEAVDTLLGEGRKGEFSTSSTIFCFSFLNMISQFRPAILERLNRDTISAPIY